MPKDRLHVNRDGSIVDALGGVLYDAQDISDLSRAARKRLAEIHTEDPDADWDKAEQILEREGLL